MSHGTGSPRSDVVDSRTGEVLSVVKIRADRFRREFLELPPGFSGVVGSHSRHEVIPLILQDTCCAGRARRYVCDWYAETNVLGGLEQFYRDHSPGPDNMIVLEPVDPANRVFGIRVEGHQQQQDTEEGLPVGSSYQIVGGRRQGLGPSFVIPLGDLLTHVFICGVTGSGKTVLAKSIIEQAVMRSIPAIIIDLKGDMSSLPLVICSDRAEELSPWVAEGDSDEDRREAAAEEVRRHWNDLAAQGVTHEDVRRYAEAADFRVYTPRSSRGLRLGFSSSLKAPEDARRILREEKETFDNLVASVTSAFVDRLYRGVRQSRIEIERNYVYELVHYAWQQGVSLEGESGLQQLLSMVQDPPFDTIGGLPVPQYIDADSRRKRLLNKINTLLSGPERMWFDGPSPSMDLLLKAAPGRVPVSIVNLAEIEHFEDRSFVVAQIAFEVYKWMRKQRGTNSPRVLFFVDEIGGGGGRQALFPSLPYECAAKWGLNYLLRQGRSFGVCCMFATQNPGDVDYKGLSNCGTWIVGKLATQRDRRKILEGMAAWGSKAQHVEQNIANCEVGDFVVKRPGGAISYTHAWLPMSYHRVLTTSEVGALYDGGRLARPPEDSQAPH